MEGFLIKLDKFRNQLRPIVEKHKLPILFVLTVWLLFILAVAYYQFYGQTPKK